ncbi:MAG: sigma-70 family RNA polymerase sigma factor [Clostridia bacterium]|nr:sigma-70 family RNA polymerase sigma factor [Clostridia bacterium]
MLETDDSKIVDLYLARDESAVSHTAGKYGAKIRAVANRILNDEAAAEECENDTYLAVWKLIPPNEPRTYLFPFLCKVARFIATNEARKRKSSKRSAILCELTDEMEECIPSSDSDVERIAEAKELGRAISSFLETRSEEQGNVFVRRYWFFDSIEELSKRYGFSKSKVKMILSRMRRDLKEYLRKEGYQI